ncbi:hypothetical protein SEVIR_3G330045v4 [Setaria viridis]
MRRRRRKKERAPAAPSAGEEEEHRVDEELAALPSGPSCILTVGDDYTKQDARKGRRRPGRSGGELHRVCAKPLPCLSYAKHQEEHKPQLRHRCRVPPLTPPRAAPSPSQQGHRRPDEGAEAP